MKDQKVISSSFMEVSNHLYSISRVCLDAIDKLVASDQKMESVIAKALREDLDTSTLLSMKAVSFLINSNAVITYCTSG